MSVFFTEKCLTEGEFLSSFLDNFLRCLCSPVMVIDGTLFSGKVKKQRAKENAQDSRGISAKVNSF